MTTSLPSTRRRALAYVFDSILVTMATGGWLHLQASYHQGATRLNWAQVAVLIIMPFLYRTLFLAAIGQTLGKMVLRLRVVDAVSGGSLSLSQACIRALSSDFEHFFGFLFFVLALFRSDRRQMADLLAGTRVVQESTSYEPEGPRPVMGLLLFLLSLMIVAQQFSWWQSVEFNRKGVSIPQNTLSFKGKFR